MKLKITAILSLAILMTCATAMFAQSDKTNKKNIVDTAVAAGNFKTLATALEAAGLIETLKGKGPFTVFAPNDEAFAKLPPGTLDDLLKDPAKLKQILLYHVVAGNVTAKQVSGMKSATSVQGATIKIMTHNGKVMVNNANVTTADIMASNGIIHVIDSVIMSTDVVTMRH